MSTHRVKSVQKLFRLVEALDRKGEMGVTELARETGLAKSSVYKYLDTLYHLGFVTKSKETYALSWRWFQIGKGIRQRWPVYQAARAELDRLAGQTGETVSLVVEEDGYAVYVYQVSARDQPAAPVEEGGRIPAPISAGGKMILSSRPSEEVKRIFEDHDMAADVEEFLAELQSLWDQHVVFRQENSNWGMANTGGFDSNGYDTEPSKPYQSLRCITVPVRNTDGDALAAIELSGSETSLYGRRFEDEFANLIVNARKSIESILLSQNNPD